MVIFILIGIIDSGLGAINVLNHLIRQKKYNEYILYLDYIFNPYGEKDEFTLYNRLIYIINYLKKKKCKKIIIACNTLSIVAKKYNIDNIITPIDYFIETIKNYNNNSLLLATKYTINSNYYNHTNKLSIDLVNYIEGNNSKGINSYTLLLKNYKTLLLGCTHYGLIFNKLKNYMIIDSGKILSDNININGNKLKVNIFINKINHNIVNHIMHYMHINRYHIKYVESSI